MTPTHVAQMGTLDFLLEAGFMAKIVLMVLVGTSIFCWAIIFTKWKRFSDALSQNKRFVDLFWGSKRVEDIMEKASSFPKSPAARVFEDGIKELKRLTNGEASGLSTQEKYETFFRALVRSSTREMTSLEKHLGWLATTASAAPFVGLFGTVWGIMNSFQSIGATGNANLAVVAPGISEALITTAAGIGAAIPAVIGYNYFAGQAKRVASDLDSFAQDFAQVVQRGSSTRSKASGT